MPRISQGPPSHEANSEVALTSLTPDASIKAGTFQFTPPQGITVENLMNQDAPERPLLQ